MTDDAPVTEQPHTRLLDELLDDIYHGQERISQVDIYRRAVAAELPAQLLARIAALPRASTRSTRRPTCWGGTAG